jgi:hypothetical protein
LIGWRADIHVSFVICSAPSRDRMPRDDAAFLKPLFPEQVQTSNLSGPLFGISVHLRFNHGDSAQSQGPLCGDVSNVVGGCEKNFLCFALASIGVTGAALELGVNYALAADDCITESNLVPPKGTRWEYRTDRAANRKCWFLMKVTTAPVAPQTRRWDDTDVFGFLKCLGDQTVRTSLDFHGKAPP